LNTSIPVPPLSLYIHIPWCIRKCPYCDFNSHEIRDNFPEKDYIKALLADIEHDLQHVLHRPISSIFIGGGTPGLFSADSFDALFSGLRQQLSFDHDLEITLEVNPGAIEEGKFSDFHAAGINRLSIGVQSFNDDMLGKLGRIHDHRAAIKAAEAAHYAGFSHFNLDLMFGLPGQNTAMARKDLEYATSLQPGHISWYQLTLEPNTLLYQHPPSLPDDDLIWQIQEHGQDYLAKKGYQQYEISAYGHNHQCRHNINYWEFGDYLGIGAGAHSKLSTKDISQVLRQQRRRHPSDYIKQAAQRDVISSHRLLGSSDLILEFMMNVLRLNNGIHIDQFQARTGLEIDHIRKALDIAMEKELLLSTSTRIQSSARGHQYLNDLLALFMDLAK